jgi:ABC-2 type transport system ATP-binding protein
MNGEPLIDVAGLTKLFGNKRVVNALSLTVGRGEIFGFLGPNGSGKTTSIRMLCGLLTPDAGSGTCLGYDIRRQTAQIKRQVGYMTQRFSLYEDLSIVENLDFIARVYQLPDRRQAVAGTMRDLGLEKREKQLAGTLSGGWKQRLALAACMLHRPRLLLLDEPTAGVDPRARRDFWDETHRLAAAGISVLVSTHYMDEAARCHRLGYIAEGNLLAQGTPAELIAASGLATWLLEGPDPAGLAARLHGLPGVGQVVPLGNVLRVSGTDAQTLAASLKPYAALPDQLVTRVDTNLEDVFIHLMESSREATA